MLNTVDETNLLVSVIVPVYNVEPYVEKCVRSLMAQDHEELEIILVDDGSTDGSGAICDELALTDARIRVIHKENGGVSAARNSGLEVASGAYVVFVDGDDYVTPDYVSYLLQLVLESHCDIAMNENNFDNENMRQIARDNRRVVKAEAVIEWIYLEKIFVAVWNKIYKRSFLNDHSLRFRPEIWYGEGMLFNIECLQYTESVAIGSQKVYYQVFNPNSAMRKFNLESNFCGMRSMELQKSAWKKKTQRIELAWKYHYSRFANSIFSGLVRTHAENDHKDVFARCLKEIRRTAILPLLVNIPVKKKLHYLVYAAFPMQMARRGARKHQRYQQEAVEGIDGEKGL